VSNVFRPIISKVEHYQPCEPFLTQTAQRRRVVHHMKIQVVCPESSRRAVTSFYALPTNPNPNPTDSTLRILPYGFYPTDSTLRILPCGFYPTDSTLRILPYGFYPTDSTLRIPTFRIPTFRICQFVYCPTCIFPGCLSNLGIPVFLVGPPTQPNNLKL
jgi:hypothetical protein